MRVESPEIGSPDEADRWIATELDGLESQFIELRRNRDFKRGRKGSGPTYAKGSPVRRCSPHATRSSEALADFQRAADADLAAILHEELLGCVDEYERLKAREGALDFLDLLVRARNLLRDDAAVRRHFQTRFTRIFVDEFQDTDPLQAEVLLLLAADDPGETDWRRVSPVRGKLFVVGDPKQSIYRFRRADVETYLQVCEQLKASGAQTGRAPQELPQRPEHPARRECGVPFGHGRQPRDAAGALRAAGTLAHRSRRPAVGCGASSPGAVLAPVHHRQANRTVAAGCGWRITSPGCSMKVAGR